MPFKQVYGDQESEERLPGLDAKGHVRLRQEQWSSESIAVHSETAEAAKTAESAKTKARTWPRLRKTRSLLFLVFVLGRFDAAVMRGLCLRLFHGLFGLFGLLGADCGTFLAFFVENLLAAQQFEESLVGAVPFIPVSTNDARVPTFPIAEPWPYRVE